MALSGVDEGDGEVEVKNWLEKKEYCHLP